MADGILKVGQITTSSGSGTITIGQSGETVNIAGKSINVTPNNTLAQVSNNSTTWADIADVELVVTPSSTSSKFIIGVNYNIDAGASGNYLATRLMYNHSGISQSQVDASYGDYGTDGTGTRLNVYQSQLYTLSPSTTNEITFNLQFAAGGGYTVYLNRKTMRLTAWEYE